MERAPLEVRLGPARVNLSEVRAGDRNLMNLVLTSKGEPLDLTGRTVTAEARRRLKDPDPVVTAVIEVTDPENGLGTLRWPGDEVAAALAGLDEFAGFWWLRVNTPGEDPVTIAAGTFEAER